MITMKAEYAQKLLDGGCAFGHKKLSCHDDLLVIDDNEDYYRTTYYGTQLINGKLQINDKGLVKFHRVEPDINENTRWGF